MLQWSSAHEGVATVNPSRGAILSNPCLQPTSPLSRRNSRKHCCANAFRSRPPHRGGAVNPERHCLLLPVGNSGTRPCPTSGSTPHCFQEGLTSKLTPLPTSDSLLNGLTQRVRTTSAAFPGHLRKKMGFQASTWEKSRTVGRRRGLCR